MPSPRVIFHIDMDAFYASVEQRDHPDYRGKPLIVGSPPNQRGVVCACSYEARKFGVKSAMPSRTAGKLCPKGIFVRPRKEAYRAESALIMEILSSFTDKIERVSVDEAYLDLSDIFRESGTGTGTMPATIGEAHGTTDDDGEDSFVEDSITVLDDAADYANPDALSPDDDGTSWGEQQSGKESGSGGPPLSSSRSAARGSSTHNATDKRRAAASTLSVASSDAPPALSNDSALMAALPLALQIKNRIRSERGLTSSIGIGSNKFLAKLGSEFKKPDGLFTILDREKVTFLRPLSIRDIHGVGPVTAEALEKAGVLTIGDLQDTKVPLEPIVGSFAHSLKARAFGEDSRIVDTSDERKSISSETTFLEDTDHRPTLRAALKELAADVADTLTKHHLGALTIQVKVRYTDFTTPTRQLRVQTPLTNAAEIYKLACLLLAKNQLVTAPLRLIGIGVATLVPPQAQQLTLL